MIPDPGVRSSELLGFPADARVLLVNADDMGMYPGVNAAIVDSIEAGIVGSCSLMTPCPAAGDAVALLRDRPEIRVGVHLTLVRDSDRLWWGPLSPRERVPTLLDETGGFRPSARIPELLARARLDEIELELRAQIHAAGDAGLTPTHLDWHCLADGGRADVLELTCALAREYDLAARVWLEPGRRIARRTGCRSSITISSTASRSTSSASTSATSRCCAGCRPV